MDFDEPDLGGKGEPTRLGKRGAMTYVGSVVLAALHHWVNVTPRGGRAGGEAQHDGSK